jgi:hypothetical protein
MRFQRLTSSFITTSPHNVRISSSRPLTAHAAVGLSSS